MARNGNGNDDWRDRVHEVVLDSTLVATVKQWVVQQQMDVDDALERIVADGMSCKVRYVDSYTCYTISVSFPRSSKIHKGQTFWFYWGDVGDGIRIAAWMLDELLPDIKISKGLNRTIGF